MKKRVRDKLRRKNHLKPSGGTEPGRPPARTLEDGLTRSMRADFAGMKEELLAQIDEFDDEEFIRDGKEAFPYFGLVKIVDLRDHYFAKIHHVPEADEPYAMLADYNALIDEAWRKVAEKWKKAELLFPELAESLRGEWGNIHFEEGKSLRQSDMEEIKHGLDEAVMMRAGAYEKLAENPDDTELAAVLRELENGLIVGQRRLSTALAKNYIQLLVDIDMELHDNIENADDGELILNVLDTDAARHIQQYSDIFANAKESLKNNLDPADEPEKLIDLCERTVIENRKKLQRKRAAAEKRHPHLKKEYPMNADYNKTLADLVEAIKTRDEMAEDLKLRTPKERVEGRRLYQALAKKIEQAEQLLADQYESAQTGARAKDVMRFDIALSSDGEQRQLRQYLKDNPDELTELQIILAEEFPGKL